MCRSTLKRSPHIDRLESALVGCSSSLEPQPRRAFALQNRQDDCLRARERYFAVRIVPTLLAWAALVAATSAVVGALIPPGVSLTLYFSGAAVLVVWLERRARSLLAMP